MNIFEKFEEIFDVKADEKRLLSIQNLVGEKKLERLFNYWLISGIYPPKPGQRFNPYGLIMRTLNRWDKEDN